MRYSLKYKGNGRIKIGKIIRDKVFKKALEESFIKYDIVCRTLAKRNIEPHYFAHSLLGQRGDKK